MAFRKAQELIRLAEMAGSRHRGICLNDVSEAFGVNNRTAQRMVREFEETFPSYICSALLQNSAGEGFTSGIHAVR